MNWSCWLQLPAWLIVRLIQMLWMIYESCGYLIDWLILIACFITIRLFRVDAYRPHIKRISLVDWQRSQPVVGFWSFFDWWNGFLFVCLLCWRTFPGAKGLLFDCLICWLTVWLLVFDWLCVDWLQFRPNRQSAQPVICQTRGSSRGALRILRSAW